MKTYTLEELRLAQAKGCKIEGADAIGQWWPLPNNDLNNAIGVYSTFRIHPADEWKARLPRLKEGAEWCCSPWTSRSDDLRPAIVGENFPKRITVKQGEYHLTDAPIPPEFLHPDELAKQPKAAQAHDFGEPLHPSYSKGSEDKENEWVFEARSNEYRTRIIACVNALSGVPDPAEFVRQAMEMRETMKDVRELLQYCVNRALDKTIEMQPDDSAKGCVDDVIDWAESALTKLKPFLP